MSRVIPIFLILVFVPLFAHGAMRFTSASTQKQTIGTNKVNPVINGSTVVVASVWINPATFPGGAGRGRALSVGINGTNAGITMGTFGTGGIECSFRSVTTDTIQQTTVTVASNEWHHLACVADYPNDSVMLYMDGILVKTLSATFANTRYTAGTPTAADIIGSNVATDFLNGTIDDLRVYGLSTVPPDSFFKTLASSRQRIVNTLVNNNKWLYWPLDDGFVGVTSDALLDRSPNHLDTAGTNSPVWRTSFLTYE